MSSPIPPANSQKPTKYRSHWPAPIWSNSSIMWGMLESFMKAPTRKSRPTPICSTHSNLLVHLPRDSVLPEVALREAVLSTPMSLAISWLILSTSSLGRYRRSPDGNSDALHFPPTAGGQDDIQVSAP